MRKSSVDEMKARTGEMEWKSVDLRIDGRDQPQITARQGPTIRGCASRNSSTRTQLKRKKATRPALLGGSMNE